MPLRPETFLQEKNVRLSSKVAHNTCGLIVLLFYATILIATNQYITHLDDETTIIVKANFPVTETLRLFITSAGQHEHPPLTDILLHYWLKLTDNRLDLLRILSIIFFVLGIYTIAQCGRHLAGNRGFWATILVAILWPFGFHYGRITGWYAICFFLVALLTYEFLMLIDKPTRIRWLKFISVATLLVWSNYYGWVLLASLLLYVLIWNREFFHTNLKKIILTALVPAILFLPLAKSIIKVVEHSHLSDRLMPLVNAAYATFSLLTSVAIAPWHLVFSIPVVIFAVAAGSIVLRNPTARPFMLLFGLQLILLTILNHLIVKRLLFITPWFLLSLGVAMGGVSGRLKNLLGFSITIIFVIGWFGIVSGRYYSATNLHEPWQKVANQTVPDIRQGATVISNNPSYFFYLNYELDLQREAGNFSYLGQDIYARHGYNVLSPLIKTHLPDHFSGRVVLVKGAATPRKVTDIERAQQWLDTGCVKTSDERSMPDPAIIWKQKFKNSMPAIAYRTEVIRYECGPNVPMVEIH
jgi:hypothetical protein